MGEVHVSKMPTFQESSLIDTYSILSWMIDVKIMVISKIHRILLCHEIYAEKAIGIINQKDNS